MSIKLKDISKLISKGSTPRSKINYSRTEANGFLRVTDITNYKRIQKTELTLSDDDFAKNKMRLWPEDTVLISIEGTIGKVAILNKAMAINQAVAGIVVDQTKIFPEYLMYYLKSTSAFGAIAKGTIMPAIRLGDISNLEINPPSIESQRKIIGVLQKIDSKIEYNNRTNDNLHNIAETMFREVYNTGSPETLSSLLHSVESGSRPKGGAVASGIPSIGAEKIEKFGYYDFSSEKFINYEYYQRLKHGKLKDGDVLLYKDGAYTGKSSLALDGFPHSEAAVNEHVFILNTKNNFAQFFLYFCVYVNENRDKLHTLAAGKAAQPGLNQSELGSIDILLPEKEKIKAFEKSVSPLMHQIAQNAKENLRLTHLRDTLLPELINGKIDLSKVEI